MASIIRFRGNTTPDRIRVKDVDGVAYNVAGCTFFMVINRLKEPTDHTQRLALVDGTIVSAAAGTVDFTFSSEQAAIEAGKFYFDITMVNTLSQLHTILQGTYTMKQSVFVPD